MLDGALVETPPAGVDLLALLPMLEVAELYAEETDEYLEAAEDAAELTALEI